MPTDKQIVAFKIGARARKLANEDCVIEGYEMLLTAIEEAKQGGDSTMEGFLRAELARYEKRIEEAQAEGP